MSKKLFILAGLLLALASRPQGSAATFIEPGGDSCACITLYGANVNTPTIDTTTVHTGRSSIKFVAGTVQSVTTPVGVVSDAGGRFSGWHNISAVASNNNQLTTIQSGPTTQVFNIRTSGTTGKLQLNTAGTTLCTGTTVLTNATWFRMSASWVITSSTVHVIKLYVNGGLECTETNAATLFSTGGNRVLFQNGGTPTVFLDDVYVDNDTSNTEPGGGNTGTGALTYLLPRQMGR